MMLPPLAAGVGIEGIIWIIILIFWSIAQYAQKNRAAQRRPPIRPGQPPPRPPTRMETELQDLLRELSGQPPVARELEEEIEVEPEPVRPAPPPPPPAPPQQTLASARKPATPEPPRVRRAPEPVALPTPRPAQPDYIASVGELSEGMGAAFAHSGKMPGLTLKMPSVSLRGVSYSGSASSSRTSQSTLRLSSLRNPATLRQMVIGRLVLDKPKALENSSGF